MYFSRIRLTRAARSWLLHSLQICPRNCFWGFRVRHLRHSFIKASSTRAEVRKPRRPKPTAKQSKDRRFSLSGRRTPPRKTSVAFGLRPELDPLAVAGCRWSGHPLGVSTIVGGCVFRGVTYSNGMPREGSVIKRQTLSLYPSLQRARERSPPNSSTCSSSRCQKAA